MHKCATLHMHMHMCRLCTYSLGTRSVPAKSHVFRHLCNYTGMHIDRFDCNYKETKQSEGRKCRESYHVKDKLDRYHVGIRTEFDHFTTGGGNYSGGK